MNKLLFPSILLASFGLFNLLGINNIFFQRQLIFLNIGVIIFFISKKIGRYFFLNNAGFFYWLLVFVLLITFIIGIEIKGSKRWIDFYFFQFQPSEIFKIFFILYFANIFSQKNLNYRILFWKSLLYFIVPTFIIFKQPDLGNAMVLVFLFFILLFFSNIPKKYILKILIFLVFLIPILWFLLAPYQKSRIIAFLNPHTDRYGIAYNMHQSIITIGSGKFFGRGLGLGTQSKLYFLPENKTDFAFASLVEQFGFMGGALIIISFAFIFYFLIKEILNKTNFSDTEERKIFLLELGILSYIFFQFFVNVGMNLGVLPVAGVALPSISYGGTAVITYLFSLSLL
ncbi:MAG: FtsW/RodA/SpoVE family cell cycle protein [Microgenomates group bacterium]